MSIPTTGRDGVRFRSRLEARWAAFFHLLGWPWQYEPDLGLEGWIPDFMITRGAGLLIEVKPVRSLDGFADHYPRIEAAKVVAPVWLVGAALFYSADREDPPIGMFGWNGGWSDRHFRWEPATLKTIAKQTDSDWFGMTRQTAVSALQRKWVQASNALQWKRR